jgi:ubiquinone/menaquinone biosynthesis C-methylase UbiE
MFTNPLKNLQAFQIKEHDVVADVGAGTGFYAIPAARIAHLGKVYAVDIQKDFLITIKNYAKEHKIHNLETIWGDGEQPGGTKIGEAVVDKVIASNIFSHIEDKNKLITEIRRILKIGGEVLVIDWIPEEHIFEGHKGVEMNELVKILESVGFKLERKIDAGAHHYGMILKRV